MRLLSKLLSTAALFTALAAWPSLASAEEDKKTARLWKSKCSSCHGADGVGQTEQGKKTGVEDMTTAAWQKDRTDAKIKEQIEKGVKREKNGKKQEMDAFGKDLKPDQIEALLKFVRALEKK